MVKDVVVDQGGGVDHLGDDGDHALALLGPPHHPSVRVESMADAHRDHWTQPLASPVKVILSHLTQLCVHLAESTLKLEFGKLPPAVPFPARHGSRAPWCRGRFRPGRMGLAQVDPGDDQLQKDCRWQLGSVRATVVDCCWAKHKVLSRCFTEGDWHAFLGKNFGL